MTTGKSGHNGPGTTQANKWSAKQWFLLYGAVLLAWAALYLLSHSKMGIPGYEHARFSPADIRHINSILVAPAPASPQANYGRQPVTNTNDGFLDSYDTDSAAADYEPYIATFPENNAISNIDEQQGQEERVKKTMIYISSQYGEEIDPAQMATIQQYISTFTPRETGIFLADYRLRLQSFFWLSGKLLYAEVVCWVIFGVLCSLLFFIGKNASREDGISQRLIIYQSARLLYAPFAAVILVLIYSYLKGNTTLHIEASELVIIFGFLLGFYSGAVMEVLDRLRGNYVQPNNYAPVAATPPAGHAPAATTGEEIPNYDNPPATEVHAEPETITDVEEEPYIPAPLAQKRKLMNDDNEISEVDIDLKLDFSGLFDEERAQLQRLGFSRAIVTLHNVNGKDIIPAKKASEDMTTFVASDVKPGIYIARATLSQRLRDDQIINLFGEKTAYITEDKPGLELFVKKYEAAD